MMAKNNTLLLMDIVIACNPISLIEIENNSNLNVQLMCFFKRWPNKQTLKLIHNYEINSIGYSFLFLSMYFNTVVSLCYN